MPTPSPPRPSQPARSATSDAPTVPRHLADHPVTVALRTAAFALDDDDRILAVNPAAIELLGAPSADALCGRAIGDVYRAKLAEAAVHEPPRNPALDTLVDISSVDLPVETRATQVRALKRPLARSPVRRLERIDGSRLSVRDWLVPGDDGVVWLLVEDVTELEALRHEQAWLLHHDPVTGLPNRRSFESTLERALERARAGRAVYAFGYLDLDDFDIVADTFGQVAGDELLRQITVLVRRQLGADDQLARLADDRFGMLLDGVYPEQAETRAAALRAALGNFRFGWQQESFEVSATFGLVPIGRDSGDLVQLFGAADAAASRARSELQAIHQFDANNTQDVDLAEHYGEMRWLARIHRALKKGRFCLYRQPIVSTAAVAAGAPPPFYEILIRMLDADGGPIPPGAFIPAAERFHLIADIDRWVVRTALRQLADDGGASYAITLNLSGQSLSESRFLDFVVEQVAASGVDPQRVCFEITETAAVAHLARVRRFIDGLRAAGCRFILDDFGSGLSSFAYLQQLPVDLLKIDGAFVRDMVRDPLQRAIVGAVHHVAGVLELGTVGEFVEDEATLEALRAIGVDYAQGYHIQRPEPWT
ncbi:MAG: EAL domain-containing protein [Acidobacteriota bacterium]